MSCLSSVRSTLGRALAPLAILAPALAQAQFAELGERHLPRGEDGTLAVSCCDVDGDGDADLVVGNGVWARHQNRLYVNDGTGKFTDATTSRMPVDSDDTRASAFCDVDGDGDADLVFGNSYQNRLYLNDGTGAFTDATASRMPADTDTTTAVACCDVDGDGDADLVFGNSYQNRLYLNDGTGAFTDASASRMPADTDSTTAVACCDVDGDGDADLVFGNSTRQQNRLYLNDGSGTFTDATTSRMPMFLGYTSAVACCDVDGDGAPDLVFGESTGQNRLYLNDGSGTFTDATTSRMPVDSDSAHAMACCDVDGDGDADLVFGNWGNYTGQQNRLYLNDGSGTFTDGTASRLPAHSDFTMAVACCDVDGDGDADLVMGNWENYTGQQNWLYLNDGSGTFADGTASRLPPDTDSSWAVACSDVDGDGDSDLVLANGQYFWGQQNRLYLNDGSGTFTDATASRMPIDADCTQAVACCDVDGDGDPDLVFGNAGSPGQQKQNRLYLNDGRGTFTDATATSLPMDSDGTSAVACCDVDGDGDPDLVFGNGANCDPPPPHPPCPGTQNRLYLNDGSGIFTDATASRMPPYAEHTGAVVSCDVDSDGDLDLVFGNWGQNRLYLNDGGGIFTDATASRIPPDGDDTATVACLDADGDGDSDLVFGNPGQNRLYLNDGSGMFTDATASRMPPDTDQIEGVVSCDLDGDGDPDLVFGNVGGPNRLYLNLLHQLDSPFLLRTGRTFTLDAYARHGPASLVDVAFPFISRARKRIPLPPLGTLGIDPGSAIALPSFVIPQPAGVGSVSVLVPSDPSLVGRAVHAQALLLRYPVQNRLTNVTSDVVWR